MKELPLLIFLILTLLLGVGFAQTECGPEGEGYRLCVPLPGQPDQVANFGDYVKMIYQFALAIAGVVVFVRVVYGGVMYILSAGNIVEQKEARDIIFQAIYGLVLLFMAVIILYIVNPSLLVIGRNIRQAPQVIPTIPSVRGPQREPPRTRIIPVGPRITPPNF